MLVLYTLPGSTTHCEKVIGTTSPVVHVDALAPRPSLSHGYMRHEWYTGMFSKRTHVYARPEQPLPRLARKLGGDPRYPVHAGAQDGQESGAAMVQQQEPWPGQSCHKYDSWSYGLTKAACAMLQSAGAPYSYRSVGRTGLALLLDARNSQAMQRQSPAEACTRRRV